MFTTPEHISASTSRPPSLSRHIRHYTIRLTKLSVLLCTQRCASQILFLVFDYKRLTLAYQHRHKLILVFSANREQGICLNVWNAKQKNRVWVMNFVSYGFLIQCLENYNKVQDWGILTCLVWSLNHQSVFFISLSKQVNKVRCTVIKCKFKRK